MRIYNQATDTALQAVTLLLTLDELEELQGAIELLRENLNETHRHVNDEKYEQEITLAALRSDFRAQLSPRMIHLVEKNT